MENYKSFGQRGSKDKYKNTNYAIILVSAMSACKNFVNETTLTQEALAKRGVNVIRTPKAHAELAGEGI